MFKEPKMITRGLTKEQLRKDLLAHITKRSGIPYEEGIGISKKRGVEFECENFRTGENPGCILTRYSDANGNPFFTEEDTTKMCPYRNQDSHLKCNCDGMIKVPEDTLNAQGIIKRKKREYLEARETSQLNP